jgi:rare lipoprotein A (peptidoglycan hydrolase)
MMSGKPLDSTPGACWFWRPFMVADYFILLLLACVAIPARADTVLTQPSMPAVSASENLQGADESIPASDTIPHSSFPSESMSSSTPETSNDQYLLREQTAAPKRNLHLDESMHLRSDLGTAVQRGTASWYGPGFHGRKSADGERFNMYSMTAAHLSLPLLSWVLVRNVRNNKVALLKVTDRGPYRSKRILDVSYAAAKQLDFIRSGTAQVEVRQLSQSEASWVRRQLDEGSEMSTEEEGSSSVGTHYESEMKVQEIIRHDDK